MLPTDSRLVVLVILRIMGNGLQRELRRNLWLCKREVGSCFGVCVLEPRPAPFILPRQFPAPTCKHNYHPFLPLFFFLFFLSFPATELQRNFLAAVPSIASSAAEVSNPSTSSNLSARHPLLPVHRPPACFSNPPRNTETHNLDGADGLGNSSSYLRRNNNTRPKHLDVNPTIEMGSSSLITDSQQLLHGPASGYISHQGSRFLPGTTQASLSACAWAARGQEMPHRHPLGRGLSRFTVEPSQCRVHLSR